MTYVHMTFRDDDEPEPRKPKEASFVFPASMSEEERERFRRAAQEMEDTTPAPIADTAHALPDEPGAAPVLHIYKVGMGTGTALVEAPSAFASAVYYGAHMNTNAPLGAVVYEVDGKKYEGDQPWIEWQLNWNRLKESERAAAIQQIEAVADTIPHCRFVEASE